MQLRPSTPADLDLLRRWHEPPHAIASEPDYDWGWESELSRSPEWREQPMAEGKRRPIGFIRISTRPAKRAATGAAPLLTCAPSTSGSGMLARDYGTAMVHLALGRCFAAAGVPAVPVDPLASNTRAYRSYEQLGFCITTS